MIKEEPRRRPADLAEEDYYDDELEDIRPSRRPLRRRPSYRDRDRDRDRDRSRRDRDRDRDRDRRGKREDRDRDRDDDHSRESLDFEHDHGRAYGSSMEGIHYKSQSPNNTIMIRGLAQHITENDVGCQLCGLL